MDEAFEEQLQAHQQHHDAVLEKLLADQRAEMEFTTKEVLRAK